MGLDMWFRSKRSGEDEPRELGYTSNSNAVFGWIERNVGEIGNYADLPMGREHFVQLKADCEFVLAHRDKAEEVMPVREGFYFGSYKYDKYYFYKLENAVEICDKVLSEVDFDSEDVFFHAWW